MSRFRLGIDVGTAMASAVLIDDLEQVQASFTTPRAQSLTALLDNLLDQVSNEVDLGSISYTAIVTNIGQEAIVRGSLSKVGTLRISAPASSYLRPVGTWPAGLVSSVSGESAIVEGGCDYAGRELVELDREAVRDFAIRCRDVVGAVAVTGLGSTVDPRHEQEAAEIIRSVLGHRMPVTLAYEIGGLGLIERENSAILNAALVRSFARTFRSWSNILVRRGVTSEIFFAQNDGTLMSATEAARHPVLTIGNTTSHAMKGAAYLSGSIDSIVAHAQTTTIRFGALVGGYPSESTLPTNIEGIRTHHRMPDLITVHPDGPLSGRLTLTSRERAECVSALRRTARGRYALPFISVGDCADVLHEVAIDAAHPVERVEHATAAAAVGAAVADVSATADRTCDYERHSRKEALAEATTAARLAAVRAGADVRHVCVDSVDEVALGYTPGPVARIRVRAVGPPLIAPAT